MGGRKVQSNQNKTTKRHRRKLGPSTTSTDGRKKLSCHYPSEEAYDKCHNADIPCSNGIREIVQAIFPESIKKDASQLPLHDQKNETTTDFKQSIFTLLVRKYLLDKYKAQINSIQSHQQDSGMVDTSVKKKRKKKKKKKSTDDATRDNSNNANLLETGDIDIPQHGAYSDGPIVDEWAWDEEDDGRFDLGSTFKSSLLEHSDALKVSTFVSQYMTSGTTVPKNIEPSTQKQDRMDMLNVYIDQLMKSNCASLDSQDPCTLLPDNRELASFLSYIERCYEKSLTENSKNIAPESRYLPSMSTSEISSIIERIQCRHCRNACHNYLESITSNRSSVEVDWGGIKTKKSSIDGDWDNGKTQIGTSVLNGSSVQVSQREKASSLLNSEYVSGSESLELDQAFGYRQLEEGDVGNTIKLKEDKMETNSLGGLCLDVVQFGAYGPKFIELDVGMNKSLSPFSADNIEHFVKDVILECGLNHQNEIRMSDEMLAQIEFKANEMNIVFKDHLKLTMDVYFEFQNDLNGVISLERSNDFSVIASRSLRKCVEKQKAFLDHTLALLMMLDKNTKFAQVYHHPKQTIMQDFVSRPFQTFETCLKRLIQPNLIRIWKMKEYQSGRDKLLLFNDPTQREFLTTMLIDNGLILKEMYEALLVFDGHNVEGTNEEGGMSFFVLAATSAFIMVVNKISPIESFPWDQSIDKVFKLRNGLAITTNPRTDADTLLEDISNSRSQILLEISRAILLLDSSINDEKLDSKQMSIWNANKIIMEESEICDQNFKEFGFSLENDVSKIDNILELTSVLLKQSRYRKELHVRGIGSCLEINIPSVIYKSIHDGKLLQERCEGGNGERRVSSILSACLYGWLEKQCIQWHADLTHEELLLDAEEDLLCEDSKKLQKKKKQKGPAKIRGRNTSASVDDTERLKNVSSVGTKENSNGVKPHPEVKEVTNEVLGDLEEWIEVGEKSKYFDKGRKLSVTRNDAPSKTTDADNENKKDNLALSNQDSTEKEEMSNMPKETSNDDLSGYHIHNSDDETVKSKSKTNTGFDHVFPESVNVGVIDRGNITSAEDFLCSRYFEALADVKIVTVV